MWTTSFFYDILGNMSHARRECAVKVYQALHHQAMVARAGGADVGIEVAAAPIPIDFLRMQFASAEHPAVKHGARAEADVLREFLETFSTTCSARVACRNVTGCTTTTCLMLPSQKPPTFR